MSDQTQQTQVQPVSGPPLLLNAQYVKELSFRVPGAPTIYGHLPERPNVVIALDVLVQPISEGTTPPIFEVTLVVKCEASVTAPNEGAPPAVVAYHLDMAYAGIFVLASVPADAVEPVLLAECPRLLFPFARRLLADITREAGFPPLQLQPIDFIAFWQSKRQQSSQSKASTETAAAV